MYIYIQVPVTVEKVVTKEVPIPYEVKVPVDRIVEVTVEKVVIKEVPVYVEKVVYQDVIVEVNSICSGEGVCLYV